VTEDFSKCVIESCHMAEKYDFMIEEAIKHSMRKLDIECGKIGHCLALFYSC
ncbi:hypothetical protein ElyMa_005074200, partial [Elysia marginata]